MFNVCENCGRYRADKQIDKPTGSAQLDSALQSWAICPECDHRHRFIMQPLMIICGPSGAGKTTVCNKLMGSFQEAVILDADILLGMSDFWESWLRLAKNIGQSGRPVVLFSSGAIPPNIEPCVEARYFSAIHYLALVYDDDLLEKRLKARPEWRNSSSSEFIIEQTRFNRWFKNEGAKAYPQMERLDTSQDPIDKTVEKVANWITSKLTS